MTYTRQDIREMPSGYLAFIIRESRAIGDTDTLCMALAERINRKAR